MDVAVVEVGLGGRLDATNAWDGGVAAVTNVALDHMEHLGSSLAAIGREKAAIIKRGDRAVTGAVGDGLAVDPTTSGSPARAADDHASRRRSWAWIEPALRIRLDDLGEVRLGMLGRHQAANAAVAVAVIEALGQAGIAERTPRGCPGRVGRRTLAGAAGAPGPRAR